MQKKEPSTRSVEIEYLMDVLRQNSRIFLSSIAQEKNIPLTTIHGVFSKCVKSGMISKFFSIVDFVKLGFFQRCIMILEGHNLNLAAGYIADSTCCNDVCFLVCSQSKFLMVDALFEDRNKMQIFMDVLADEFGCIICVHEVWGVEKSESFRFSIM